MSARAREGLRVLMVGPLPPPVGGMASVVQNLVLALGPRVELAVLDNVKTTAADRSLWQGIAAQLRLLGRLAWRCVGWRPAVVHIHTCSWFTFWRNGVDLALARLLGRRVVLHIHGAQFHRFLGGLSGPRAWLARRVLRGAHRVVVLGAGWREVLSAWADPARIVVVPNGVPAGQQVVPSPQGPFRVLCLANYEARKGQEDLLRAVAGLDSARPVRVELLGFEAEPGRRQRLLDLAAELGVADVDIPGPVIGDAKDARLAAAHCFCLPSYDEGLPMSMLEAMAVGLPVVATRVGAIPEALADGREGLLFEPGDVAALTGHLAWLIDEPEAAAALGAAGHERLAQDFSLEHSAELLLGVYRSLSAERHAGAHAGA
ncbi:MAG: glycosyltransferase family 4 protein [Thiohalocapsa sp.]|jgi:glycosyltransferase involved in cell wall biosynthesis|uniref:glycosyltransferase family 4 protein n=1 Tax=Thiohalocapsa sp. TaxID=2497641 RepID=UPI0025EAC497|nr:glycosyltransferase family 4 protein [Thiohalocapsa sp.]MCG6940281.1 glycosyltransferase family 4 protein [Thiohalocapsa sp.]